MDGGLLLELNAGVILRPASEVTVVAVVELVVAVGTAMGQMIIIGAWGRLAAEFGKAMGLLDNSLLKSIKFWVGNPNNPTGLPDGRLGSDVGVLSFIWKGTQKNIIVELDWKWD